MIYQFCLVNDLSILSGKSSQLCGWLWEQLTQSSSANNAAENMHRDLYLKWAQGGTDPFADADDAVGVDDVGEDNNDEGGNDCGENSTLNKVRQMYFCIVLS